MGQLKCSNLFCRRGGFTLDLTALTVTKGEKIALLGENGCGKTTLLQVLAGLLPAEGEITYETTRWDSLSPQDRALHAAYLPQEAEVLFNLTVDELIQLTLHSAKLLQGEARQAVFDATDTLPLLERAYPSLSGGEKRRAMLARIFCREADFVFLDEPTAPLDMRHAAKFMRYAVTTPCAIVAAMHDVNLAVRYFDRFLLMKNGRIFFDRQKSDLDAGELEAIYGIGLHRCGDHFVPER